MEKRPSRWILSRDANRTVTDRATGTVLGRVTPASLSGEKRWDYYSDLVSTSRPSGYETIYDAAYALYTAWKRS